MKKYTDAELELFASEFADILEHSKIPFSISYYPSDESEPVIKRGGEICSQIALLDVLTAEVNDSTIQSLDESTRLLALASKKIESYERRN